MSQLRIFNEHEGDSAIATFTAHADVARELAAVGIRFERWEANQPIAPGASQDAVIAAYHDDIARLKRDGGYQSVDVISLTPDHPDRAAFRKKFLSEHTHSE
ncbi:MAG: cupin, partial [Dokdonella sp.]